LIDIERLCIIFAAAIFASAHQPNLVQSVLLVSAYVKDRVEHHVLIRQTFDGFDVCPMWNLTALITGPHSEHHSTLTPAMILEGVLVELPQSKLGVFNLTIKNVRVCNSRIESTPCLNQPAWNFQRNLARQNCKVSHRLLAVSDCDDLTVLSQKFDRLSLKLRSRWLDEEKYVRKVFFGPLITVRECGSSERVTLRHDTI
jgi:hypothetical protein